MKLHTLGSLGVAALMLGGCEKSETEGAADPPPATEEATAEAAAEQEARPEEREAPEEEREPADGAAALKVAAPKEITPTDASDLGTREDDLGLAVGAEVPDFETKTSDGGTVTRDALLEQGALMVVFYRGGWCPYCNFTVRQLTEAAEGFAKHGVTPVVVSVDEMDGAAKTKASYEIPFPVLSDPDLAAHEAFGVGFTLDEEGVARLKGFGIDVEAWSDREHHTLAVPSAFLVDAEGVVRWAHVARDYKTRPTAEQLLEVVDKQATD